jgi:hypothetical protein
VLTVCSARPAARAWATPQAALEVGMERRVRGAAGVILAAMLAAGVLGCGAHSGHGSSPPSTPAAQLSCGGKTFRLDADKINRAMHDACDRANASLDALQAYRATLVRFTCQEGNGHIVSSLLAPQDLISSYDASCKEFLAAKDAFHASLQSAPAADPHAAFEQHRTAAAKFTAATNALARRHALADNALYRQRQADLAAVSQLVKNAGGSIEITN